MRSTQGQSHRVCQNKLDSWSVTNFFSNYSIVLGYAWKITLEIWAAVLLARKYETSLKLSGAKATAYFVTKEAILNMDRLIDFLDYSYSLSVD